MTELSREEQTLSRRKRKSSGVFFTPADRADFMVRRYDIHRKWAEGASILDPTAGRGSLLESLIRVCLEEEIPVTPSMLKRLRGIEREELFARDFVRRMAEDYQVEFRENPISTEDILNTRMEFRADILFGNPPWVNFTDLPEEEKESVKPYFLHYGLARTAGKLLLGNSRIDMAALIIMKTLYANLNKDGNAYFFTPLSLILNEGAHNVFRKGNIRTRNFSIREIWDYNGIEVFPGVSTRCGFLHLQKDREMEEKIPYHLLQENNSWNDMSASPIAGKGSSYALQDPRGTARQDIPRIGIEKESIPRQGINTGGRNSLFIFTSCKKTAEGLCVLENRERTARLPSDLIYPLLTTRQFRKKEEPDRFIFLPYKSDGTILSAEELNRYPAAAAYLKQNRDSLESRKGVMLRSQIKRGSYWNLLGIGPYTFFPWKIIWESYGKKSFNPRLFTSYEGKPWIPNQALQAYCPFRREEEAMRVLSRLKDPLINTLLQSQMMQGTCNWAQPGRIKVFLDIKDKQVSGRKSAAAPRSRRKGPEGPERY